MGDDIARLKQAGDSLMAVLREMDGLVWVHTKYEEALPRRTGSIGPQWKPPASGSRRRWPPADLAIRYDGPLGWLPLGRRLRLPIQLNPIRKGG